MFEIRCMSPRDAQSLERMMQAEAPEYLRHFTAFRTDGELSRQQMAAAEDRFFVLERGGELAGFFCLRGLDAGYERPSFGVYVVSRFAGEGAGRHALTHALEWCQSQGIRSVLLKVSEDNVSARSVYEGAGFSVIGVCPDTQNLMMEKRLT